MEISKFDKTQSQCPLSECVEFYMTLDFIENFV